jgi:hypothetical protein
MIPSAQLSRKSRDSKIITQHREQSATMVKLVDA